MSVAKSSIWFTLGTIVSRLSGLARLTAVSTMFGSSHLTDAFNIAYRIPNLFRDMLAEGALSSSFTKVYSELNHTSADRAHKLLLNCLWLAFLGALVISVLGALLAPLLVKLMTIKLNTSTSPEIFLGNTIGLTRVLFPFLSCMIVGAVATGALHYHGKFFYSALSPIAFNIGSVAGAVVIGPVFMRYAPTSWDTLIAERSILGLAVGTVLGGAGQVLWQLMGLRKTGFRFGHLANRVKENRVEIDADARKVLKIMVPAALAASTGPINAAINTNFAASVGEGAITWLANGFAIMQLPIGLFAVAIGAASLPSLSKSVAAAGGGIDEKVSNDFQNAFEFALWLLAPFFVLFFVNNQEVVGLFLQYGKFRASDTIATANALFAYSFGIIAYGLIKVLTALYYATARINFAMYVSVAVVGINFLANTMLVKRYGHVGLATTMSVTLWANGLMLIWGLRGQNLRVNVSNALRGGVFIALAIASSIALQRLCHASLDQIDFNSALSGKLTDMALLAASGICVLTVFVTCGLIRLRLYPREAWQIMKSMRRRNKKT